MTGETVRETGGVQSIFEGELKTNGEGSKVYLDGKYITDLNEILAKFSGEQVKITVQHIK